LYKAVKPGDKHHEMAKPTHADTAEYTLLQVIVAEHGCKATSGFDFRSSTQITQLK
jgi:hypothetical protein